MRFGGGGGEGKEEREIRRREKKRTQPTACFSCYSCDTAGTQKVSAQLLHKHKNTHRKATHTSHQLFRRQNFTIHTRQGWQHFEHVDAILTSLHTDTKPISFFRKFSPEHAKKIAVIIACISHVRYNYGY